MSRTLRLRLGARGDAGHCPGYREGKRKEADDHDRRESIVVTKRDALEGYR